MTRRIVVTQYMSLDGVVEDPVGMEGSGLGDWTGAYARGPLGDSFKHDELFRADALLLGRKTYQAFAAVWPTVADSTGFASRINAMPKYVVSRSADTSAWNNSRKLDGELLQAVRDLRSAGEGDLLVYGSISLVHALAEAGLVDQYSLMVYPVVLGRGTRLFENVHCRLRLANSLELGDGILLAQYDA